MARWLFLFFSLSIDTIPHPVLYRDLGAKKIFVFCIDPKKKMKTLLLRLWWIQRRQPWAMAIECLLPVALTIVLLVLRATLPTYSLRSPIQPLEEDIVLLRQQSQLVGYVAPSSLDSLVACVEHANRMKRFSTPIELRKAYESGQIWYGLVLESANETFTVTYRLHVNATWLPSVSMVDEVTDTMQMETSGWHRYIQSGVATVQLSVQDAWWCHENGRSRITRTMTNLLPVADQRVELFHSLEKGFGSLYVVLGSLLIYLHFYVTLVQEREDRWVDTLQWMGAGPLHQWLAWCLLYVLETVVGVSLSMLLATASGWMAWDQAILIGLAWTLYVCSLLALATIVAQWTPASRMVYVAAPLVLFLLYLPSYGLAYARSQHIQSVWLDLFTDLSSSVALDRVYTAVMDKTSPLAIHMLMLMVVDAIVYIGAAWYTIRRTERPFIRQTMEKTKERHRHNNNDDDGEYMEPVDDEPSIQIQRVTKQYSGSTSPAVDNLSLALYDDQIVSLLGHNGAGKSTTMQLLTGWLQPDSGSIVGRPAWSGMGVCPQYNVLHSALTVYEHLELAYRFKMPDQAADARQSAIESQLNRMRLFESRHQLATTLSGGQQRQVMLMMAMTGNSTFVVLDEPTTGMDSVVRRIVWDWLKQEQYGRVIVLTTHFMDEADFLGDRIAILAQGRLQCVGTSLYLKARFGIGYHLTIRQTDDHATSVSDRVLNDVSAFVPTATLGRKRHAGNQEFDIVLPLDRVHQFPSLFRHLEQRKTELGIRTFGLSLSSLEETFLQVVQLPWSADLIETHRQRIRASLCGKDDDGGGGGGRHSMVYPFQHGSLRDSVRRDSLTAMTKTAVRAFQTLNLQVPTPWNHGWQLIRLRWSLWRHRFRAMCLQLIAAPLLYALAMVVLVRSTPMGESSGNDVGVANEWMFTNATFPSDAFQTEQDAFGQYTVRVSAKYPHVLPHALANITGDASRLIGILSPWTVDSSASTTATSTTSPNVAMSMLVYVGLALLSGLAMADTPIHLAASVLEDVHSGVKWQFHMAGVSSPTYWFSVWWMDAWFMFTTGTVLLGVQSLALQVVSAGTWLTLAVYTFHVSSWSTLR